MRWIIIIFLCLTMMSTRAQHPKIAKATALVAAGKTDKAIALLKKTYSKEQDLSVALKLVDVYSDRRQIEEALLWADKAGVTTSDSLPQVLKHIDLLLLHAEFQAALDKCKAYAVRHSAVAAVRERAYAAEALLNADIGSVNYKLYELPFNTVADEISITNYRRKYVMSSDRNPESESVSSGEAHFSLFMVQQDYDKWRYPYPLLKDRHPQENRTTVSYTRDGNFVYYTASAPIAPKQLAKQPDLVPEFRIYEGVSMGNEWREVKPLPFQEEGFSYKDPAIHPDGQWLIFSSDRDHKGNFDLYFTAKSEGEWSAPESLGPNVNSTADEIMPYISEDGSLYFSSDRTPGFGGFDIYTTRQDQKIWLRPEIVSPPVNSAYDDLSYMKHYGRSGGFFVSNRADGRGGFDVYGFEELAHQLGVTVLDASTGGVMDRVEIRLLSGGVTLEEQRTNAEGVALFTVGKGKTYELLAEKEGYQPVSKKWTAEASDKSDLAYTNIRLSPVKKSEATTMDPEADPGLLRLTMVIADSAGKPIPGLEVRLINASNRMKILTTDSSGAIEQSLYAGNNYRLVYEYQGQSYEQTVNTGRWKDSADATVTFTSPDK